MQRRTFVKTTFLGGMAIGLNSFSAKEKTHIITLSFDDGFKKSFYQIADIFERYGLHACLNIIASGHLSSFSPPNAYQMDPRGDFDDWNSLQKRGHEIMPHTWDHRDLTKIPMEQAQEDIIKCLDYFKEHLEGFNASDAVYNFAYNASTPDLEQFALTKVRAVRTQGDTATNPIPVSSTPVRLGCWSHGPDNADQWVEQVITEFLSTSGGWLILNLHGLDREGWGPVSSNYLNDLLNRLAKHNFLDVLPAGQVLKTSSRLN
jgi:peptidoglycan/xylan/chitin deacetylase (PgdA/CDA1 family)